MLTPHCSAASGMVVPSSIVSTTRLRRSSEYGFAIHASLLPADSLNHIRLAMGIPRFSLLGKRSKSREVGLGHVWTAPCWQEESSLCSNGRSSHVFGLFARYP